MLLDEVVHVGQFGGVFFDELLELVDHGYSPPDDLSHRDRLKHIPFVHDRAELFERLRIGAVDLSDEVEQVVVLVGTYEKVDYLVEAFLVDRLDRGQGVDGCEQFSLLAAGQLADPIQLRYPSTESLFYMLLVPLSP